MKVQNNLDWLDREVDKLVKSIVQHNRSKRVDKVLLSDLEKTRTFRTLALAATEPTPWRRKVFLLFCLVALLGILVKLPVFRSFIPRDGQSNCLVALPNSLQNAFVPPNECTFCRNLTSIERISALSPAEFTAKFAYSKVPVVVTDGMTNWTARDVFNFEYFKALYSEETLSPRKSCQFFPYKTEFTSLQEALQMDPSRAAYNTSASKPWYIGWSNCDFVIASELRSHYGRPYFLPLDSESIRTDWLFMGTPNNGAHMHIDHVGRPSWQAQIRGKKRWFLEPPLECYGECSDHTIDVDEGHIIVLDTNVWYHKTLIVGDQVSITIGAEYD